MRFDLKGPCKDCPFIKGGVMNLSLDKSRMDGICEDITENDLTFQCHKTLPYGSPNGAIVEDQHCAGALVYLEKIKKTNNNALLRLAQVLGLFRPSELQVEQWKDQVIDEVKTERAE